MSTLDLPPRQQPQQLRLRKSRQRRRSPRHHVRNHPRPRKSSPSSSSFADMMLATARNDPIKGRILWTGNRDLTWPNSPRFHRPIPLLPGEENGDILGHIAYYAPNSSSTTNPSTPKNSPTVPLTSIAPNTTSPSAIKPSTNTSSPNFVDPKTNGYTLPHQPPLRLPPRRSRPPNPSASPSPGTSR